MFYVAVKDGNIEEIFPLGETGETVAMVTHCKRSIKST